MKPADIDTQDETLVSVEHRLVFNLIGQAKEALKSNGLEKAQELLARALGVEGDYPDRAPAVRQALKLHSDMLADLDPPEWDDAHRTLAMLETLGLQNDETRTWQRDLWLRQAGFFMDQKNLDESFKIFSQLMAESEASPQDGHAPADADALKAEISGIVRVNLSKQAKDQQWDLLRRMVDRFQKLWPFDEELNDWLKTISETLAAINQATDQAKSELEQERRRRRSITLILMALLVITPPVYYAVIWGGL
jgi:hypothetical protein